MPSVFLYVPNIIGYVRIILAVAAFACMHSHAVAAMVLYAFSCLLDAVDGQAARYYDQSSKFGAVLDMVTDRSTTAALLVYLASAFPLYAIAFQLLIALDLSSHYMQMAASLACGMRSHKQVSDRTPWLMRMYYTDSTVLFLVCFGNELLFVCLYLVSAGFASVFVYTAMAIAAPICVFKQIVSVVQLVGASQMLVQADVDALRKGKHRAE